MASNLHGKNIALIFENDATRTRSGFEVAAVCAFVRSTGRAARIGPLPDVSDIIQPRKGTVISDRRLSLSYQGSLRMTLGIRVSFGARPPHQPRAQYPLSARGRPTSPARDTKKLGDESSPRSFGMR
jgi:hypothetical protein